MRGPAEARRSPTCRPAGGGWFPGRRGPGRPAAWAGQLAPPPPRKQTPPVSPPVSTRNPLPELGRASWTQKRVGRWRVASCSGAPASRPPVPRAACRPSCGRPRGRARAGGSRPRAPAPPRAPARAVARCEVLAGLDLHQEGKEVQPGWTAAGGKGRVPPCPLPSPPLPSPLPSPPALLFGEARLPDHDGPTATTRRLAGWTSRRRSSRGPGGRRG